MDTGLSKVTLKVTLKGQKVTLLGQNVTIKGQKVTLPTLSNVIKFILVIYFLSFKH